VSPEKEHKSGLSLQTLLISSAAAVAAAVIVPMFWARGSLIATAVTPIIVAVVSEALNRPAKVITQVTPRVTRRSATGAAVRAQQPSGVGARGEGPERVSRWGSADDPFGLREPARAPRRRFPLKLAVVTGLIAAVIGAVTVTASELAIFGHSIGDSGRSTSVWGGSESPREEEPTPTATPEATETVSPEATATATEAPTEAPTVTPTPTVSAVPTPLTEPPPDVTPAPTP
jgi:hypothetical protein